VEAVPHPFLSPSAQYVNDLGGLALIFDFDIDA
jgi:hypothetical protein